MEIVTSKKKKYLLLLFVVLALAAATASIYLFVDTNKNNSQTYSVDKYSDVTDWCDTSTEDNTLIVGCKALLLEIKPETSGGSCFEVQIITKGKELKDLTVCESGDTLSYSNAVLGYKKLMPIDMVFTYTKEGILNTYSFNSVAFDKVDGAYVQDVVNEDIANLVTIDPSTTTIQNSVDFCPRYEELPEYTTNENGKNYSDYINTNNAVTEIYNMENETMNSFFPCYPSNNCKYSNLVDTTLLATKEVFPPKWGKSITNYDYDTLAQLSYLYSGKDTILPTYAPYIGEGEEVYIATPKGVFTEIIKILSSVPDTSEEIFCTVYQAVSSLSAENNDMLLLKSSMQSYINSDISKSTFPLCQEGMPKGLYDENGIYIMYSISIKNDHLEILNRCLNLADFLR